MSHHRKLINPPDLHPAPGFSHVAVARGDRSVYFAGQLGIGQDFSLVAEDLHGQTVAAMRNLKAAMDSEYETITRAIDEVTGGAEHPAQTIVGITGLAVPGCLIEIECTALVAADG